MRLLVAGDVRGRLDKLYARVEHILPRAGPFDGLLCVGRFLLPSTDPSAVHGAAGEQSLEYLKGTRPVPVPTYFIDCGASEWLNSEDRAELCPGITFLGKQGTAPAPVPQVPSSLSFSSPSRQ